MRSSATDADAAAALAAALATAGIVAVVEVDGRLALLSGAPDRLADPAGRTEAVRLARALGFTHVALLLDGPPDAPGTGADDAPR